jgi:hypothetical protein
MTPRDRTIYEPKEEPGFNWLQTAFFGGLLVVALLLKLVTGSSTSKAAAHIGQQAADEKAV